MAKDCTAVWGNCLQVIKKIVNAQSYKTWFEPIKCVSLEDHILTIQVPNKFFYEWLEENYVPVLKKALRQELGEKARLEYQILIPNHLGENGARTKNGNGKQGPSGHPVPGTFPTEDIKNPFVIPGIRKVHINHQLNPHYTFESFIEGDCNRLARSAGEAVAAKPGGTAFNPLFIFGSVGLGKTHLAQAVGNRVLTTAPNKSVLYVSTEKFMDQMIRSIKNNAVSDFVNFYQLVDVLIVDDVQFLASKQKTQEIFFHIFNQLHQTGKQVILTSDRAPKDLPGMQERLISRFKWGLSADLQVPDLETRIAIFTSKLEEENLTLPSDIVEFVCYNIQSNIRELEGIVATLVAHSALNRRVIDMELAREVVQNFVKNASQDISIPRILKIVTEYFNVPEDKMCGKSRKREFVVARQTAMYLIKKLTEHSLKDIGKVFSGRDHTTVLYSCKVVGDLMDTDPDFKKSVVEIDKRVRMSVA